jgi:hypothetical protein
MTGDFKYNGIPIFKVDLPDFSFLVESFNNEKRIYTKNILNESLAEHFKNSRDLNFGITYNGIVVDFRSYRRT